MLRVLAEAGQPRLDVRAVGGAEQALEHRARVVLHRQRRGRRAPGDGVRVGAAIALIAGPEDLDRVDGELERRELGLVAESAGGNLIHRDAGPDVGTLGLLDVHAGQPGGRGPRVVSHALALARDGDLVGQTAQHVDPLAHGRQRLQDGGQLQRLARSRRRPRAHLDPVRHVDGSEAAYRARGRVPRRGEGRNHAVEQGSASEAPRPRSTVRRGSIFFVMIICASSSSSTGRFRRRNPTPSACGTVGFPRCRESATTSGSRRPARRAGSGGPPARRGGPARGRARRSAASR